MDLHANLFRATFSDPAQAVGLLRTFLPRPLVAAADWSTLRLLDTAFLDQELRPSTADLLFSVRVGGQQALIYLLLEHKSTQDPMTAWQVLRYEVRILEQWLRDNPGATRLPLILPLVVHHGQEGWKCARDVVELFDLRHLPRPVARALRPHLPRLQFQLADLPAHDIGRLRRLAMAPLGRLVLVAMQHLRGRDAAAALAVIQQVADLVRQLCTMPGGSERLLQVWWYVFRASELDPRQTQELFGTDLDSAVKENIVSFVDRVRAEEEAKIVSFVDRVRAEEEAKIVSFVDRVRAEEQAKLDRVRAEEQAKLDRVRAEEQAKLDRVRAEGQAKLDRVRAEGQAKLDRVRAELLLRQVHHRFGPIDEPTRARILQAGAGELDRWLEAILDATSLDALLAS